MTPLIYNAEETGLYYRATPDNSLCYSYEQLNGSKNALERITVLLYVNMSWSDKLKPLVIGKSKMPRCFKGINLDTLPVMYFTNSSAWMTSVLFQQWVMDWDVALIRDNRNLVTIDNCPAHPQIKSLRNIRLEFLPANTTSLIQPLDQGIVKNLKIFYGKELIQMIISVLMKM
ncbi:Tigger transposable element-derived protein 4 [Oopsacas minuta]|uniref:Tigger transposable element-derived protein 4 n=1 Tax=Oopsacas minuta TaxID=111878 RepID=A0AAV7K2E5_9METZ|nr:Tigger transposable element-derived protein 4 [Oopsacas minuta]